MKLLVEKKDHTLIYKFIIYHRTMINAMRKMQNEGSKDDGWPSVG